MNNFYKYLIAIAILITFIYFFLCNADFNNVISTFNNLNYYYFFYAFLFYIITFIIKTSRFQSLLNNASSIKIFNIVCFSNLFLNILPFRLGELVYIYLTNKLNVKFSKNILSLYLVRIFDLITLLVIGLVTILISKINHKFNLFILTFIIILFAIIFLFKHKYFLTLIITCLNNLPKYNIVLKTISILEELKTELLKIKKGALLEIGIKSLLIWVVSLITTYFVFKSINVEISMITLAALLVFGQLAQIIPIQTPGNFGVIDSVWAYILLTQDFKLNSALEISIAIHFIMIIFSFLLGFLSLMFSLRIRFKYSN